MSHPHHYQFIQLINPHFLPPFASPSYLPPIPPPQSQIRAAQSSRLEQNQSILIFWWYGIDSFNNYYKQSASMLLQANKKSQDMPKIAKRYKPAPISTTKPNKRTLDSPSLRAQWLRVPAFDSLQVKCQGIKLNSRDSKSPEKKKIGSLKVQRVASLMRPILLANSNLPISASTSFYRAGFFTNTKHFPQNPEDNKGIKPSQLIPASDIILLNECKHLELKERMVFYIRKCRYAGLYPWQQGKTIPNIGGLLQSWGVCTLGEQNKQFFVSQLHHGFTLRSLMIEFGRFQEPTAKVFLRQLTSIVAQLHQEGYSHNRLSLDTILHDGEGNLLINYFKSARQAASLGEKQTHLYYLSPELILAKSTIINEKNDIWAIGCIALQLVSQRSIRYNGFHPYNRMLLSQEGKSSTLRKNIQRFIDEQAFYQQKLEESQTSPEASDFISQCLKLDLEKRPPASSLLFHPFFTS